MFNVFIIIPLGFVLIMSVYFDLQTDKIPNWLTLGSVPIFFITSFMQGGFQMLQSSFLASLAIGSLWWLGWKAGMIGGGDHKLLIASGSALGLPLLLPTMLSIMVMGGIQALFSVTVKSLNQRENRPSFSQLLKTTHIHYSISIMLGVAFVSIGSLQGWW